MLEREKKEEMTGFGEEDEYNEGPVGIMEKCEAKFTGGTEKEQEQTLSIHERLCNRYPHVITAKGDVMLRGLRKVIVQQLKKSLKQVVSGSP